MDIYALCREAKKASYALMISGSNARNHALRCAAEALLEATDDILNQNQLDLQAAQQNGMSQAMQDRLLLTPSRLHEMAEALRHLAAMPDPIGGADEMLRRPNGLLIAKRRVPLGVVGIIYEARPNVTADAAGICLKSGNVCVLRGGSEAIHSNIAIVAALQQGLAAANLPPACLSLVTDTNHQTAERMMGMHGYIDVLIPRGGKRLIRSVVEHAKIPVIETGEGNCHIYVDPSASLSMAAEIIINAKCSRPSVCNAAETLLLHRDIAPACLQQLGPLLQTNQVEVRGDALTCQLLPWASAATADDWSTEYNDNILAVKVVDSFEEAVAHIHAHSTRHSESIITQDYASAQRFHHEVDAAAVYVNASTRFTDGGEFGFGAEIGISTQKLHTRGPMGLHEMTTYKYCIYGDGQVR